MTGEMTGLGLAASQSLGRAWADKLLVPPAKTINQQLDGAADSCWTPRQLTTAGWQLAAAPWTQGSALSSPPTIIALSAATSQAECESRQKQFLSLVSVQSFQLPGTQSVPSISTWNFNFKL